MATIPLQSLRPGDLLLHESRGEISKLIQWVSDSDYSHVAMIFEPGLLAEAVSGGVRYDFPLAARISDKEHQFWRIDAVRPLHAGDPMHPTALAALQAAARAMAGTPFALNQMLEIGLIALAKDKLPPNVMAKLVMTWILDELVTPNADKIVCSEFVYRAFHNALVQPPDVLDPVLVVTKAPSRPFPNINWALLWKEYEEARGKQGGGPQPPPASAAQGAEIAAGAVDFERVEADWQLARNRSRSAITASAPVRLRAIVRDAPDGIAPIVAHPNPRLVLPQDLADSPSFGFLGKVVVA